MFVLDHSYGLWTVLKEVTAGVVVMMINTRHDNTLRGCHDRDRIECSINTEGNPQCRLRRW